MKCISNSKLRILHYISHTFLNYVNTITCLFKYFWGSLSYTDIELTQNIIISMSVLSSEQAALCECVICSVQFSRSVVSDSWQPHEPQHTRPPCPSPTPGVYPNLCPFGQWCHLTISSSAVPFSSCLRVFCRSNYISWNFKTEKCNFSFTINILSGFSEQCSLLWDWMLFPRNFHFFLRKRLT